MSYYRHSHLNDPNAVNYIHNELKKSNNTISLYNQLIFNLSLFFGFIFCLSVVLYIRYHNKQKKLSTYEDKKRSGILQKILNMNMEIKETNPTMITQLPKFETML